MSQQIKEEKMFSLLFILFKICFSSNLILKIYSDNQLISAVKSRSIDNTVTV